MAGAAGVPKATKARPPSRGGGSAPVVLVVDAFAMARSAGAVVLGFERFDPDLNLARVVFNRVAGDTLGSGCASVRACCRAVSLGHLPCPGLARVARAASRARDRGPPGPLLDELSQAMETSIDLERLLALAQATLPRSSQRPPLPACRSAPGSASPATSRSSSTIRPTSTSCGPPAPSWSSGSAAGRGAAGRGCPVPGRRLPRGLRARARGKRAHARGRLAFVAAGGPVYAECGGLLAAEALEDESGRIHPMVGLLPTIGRMVPKRLTLGYAESSNSRDAARPGWHHGAGPRVPRLADRPRAGVGAAGVHGADVPGRDSSGRGIPDRRGPRELPPLRLEPRPGRAPVWMSARRRGGMAVTTGVGSPKEGLRHE